MSLHPWVLFSYFNQRYSELVRTWEQRRCYSSWGLLLRFNHHCVCLRQVLLWKLFRLCHRNHQHQSQKQYQSRKFDFSPSNLQALIVNKVSSIPPGARKYVDIGRITNHFVIDMNKFFFYAVFKLHFIVSLKLITTDYLVCPICVGFLRLLDNRRGWIHRLVCCCCFWSESGHSELDR